ncbi:MAG TPA: DNA adenine methylase [Lysobacter sp.]
MQKPIIPWPGGKRRLARHILPLLETPHRTYVEPFAGGAAILFLRTPAPVEVINDTNGELVRLYRCVQHHLEELMRQFKWALVSREMFRWAQLQHVDTLTDIQRAARFFYLQKLAFGGKVTGQTFGVAATCGPRINLLRLEEDLSQAHLRLSRVTIENLPWQTCIERYDRAETLFFLAPPYWQTAGYGGDFDLVEHEQLAAAMAAMKGRAVLTINDHPDMRRIYGRFDATPLRTTYTVGGGARAKVAGELLVRNW